MRFTPLVLLIILFSWATNSYGQNYRSQQNQVFAYNILSNGFICGISSTFNIKSNEKIFPVFIKNFGKGCLGGLIKYAAKSQTYYLGNRYNTYLAPFNRAFFFLGHSIAINAARNERTLQHYYFTYYGLNFNFQPYEIKEKRINIKISASTLYAVSAFALEKHKLDFYKSLEYGQFYFDMNPNTNYQGIQLVGLSLFNTIAIRKFSNGSVATYIIPHEIVHTYQAYDYFPLSGFYKNRLDQTLNKSKAYSTITKYFDLDYESLFFTIAYSAQPTPRYYKNFYEYEAEHFSRRAYIRR